VICTVQFNNKPIVITKCLISVTSIILLIIYEEVKSSILTLMLIGFVLGGVLPSIILLVVYMELIEISSIPFLHKDGNVDTERMNMRVFIPAKNIYSFRSNIKVNNMSQFNPAAEEAKGLVSSVAIVTVIFGIFEIIIGFVVASIHPIGILGVVGGSIDIIIFLGCRNIVRLIDERNYEEAKSSTMLWMILGFIFGGILPGILLLVAYIKLAEIPPTPAPAQSTNTQQTQ